MRVAIAMQACVLTLNLDPRYYDGWENVIVYPDEFITNLEFEDEVGRGPPPRDALRRGHARWSCDPVVA